MTDDASEIGTSADFEIDWGLASGPRGYYAKTKRLLQEVMNILARDGALDGDDPETNRQVHYQLVQAGLIENTDRKYDDLCDHIKQARLDGIIPFDAIEDRTRFLRGVCTFESIGDALDCAVRTFKLDLWASQAERFEVWVEKDALIGVVAKACDPYRVDHLSTRGYVSLSEAKEGADRFCDYDQQITILHLADHDPSGVDMTRDLEERLDYFDAPCSIERVGLNPDQIEQIDPVPNYAKPTDTRTQAYFEAFPKYRVGNRVKCWELDAMPRAMLVETIQERIKSAMNAEAWNAALKRENEMREKMRKFVAVWHAHGSQDLDAAADNLVETFGREWCDELASTILERDR